MIDTTDITTLSISDLKAFIESTEPDETLIELLSSDSRAGVRSLSRKLERSQRRTEQLLHKQEKMFALEKELFGMGKTCIAGVDEAGRGPLAGPVVSAAVVLPEDFYPPGLDDSKKLTAKKREELYKQITSQAVAWGIGFSGNDEIDEIGILPAVKKTMRSAVDNLKLTPDTALVDGNQSPHLDCAERLIVNGDARCRSIAAASIIAKVTRDRIMIEMDSVFPGYGFAQHKGYGAQTHTEAIRKLGPCDIHRFTFKLVPKAAPSGTCSIVLEKRLRNALNMEMLDRAATCIARISQYLNEREIETLRSVYKTCKKRFGGTG